MVDSIAGLVLTGSMAVFVIAAVLVVGMLLVGMLRR